MPRAPALLCDLTTRQVAQCMGMSEAEFLAAMPGLISARGFPRPDPLTNRIDPVAFDGGAAPATVARGLGNTLSASNLLFRTYAPPDESASVMMLDARKSARRDKSKKPLA